MVNMNHILSGQSAQVRIIPGSRTSSFEPANKEAGQPSSPLADRFTTGQPWKNKAVSRVNGGGCRCGTCSQCGAQAYAQQQPQGASSAKPSMGVSPEMSAEDGVSVTAEQSPLGEPLRPEELAQLQELQKIDQSVRAHEQAHMGAAGGLATSGVSLSYTKGPDGQNYAVGGEVSIDTSKAPTPRETLAKMVKVRAAALAPADPSPQDRKVAASASVAMGEARLELQLDQKGDGQQVVEQAVQRIVGKGEAGASADVRGKGRGSYQRNQYQKAATDDGGAFPLSM